LRLWTVIPTIATGRLAFDHHLIESYDRCTAAGTTGWTVTMKTFLLGDGWATAWYLVHYVLLWPLWGFYTYFRDFKPGAGPQGEK
jgi:hypothetical protein